MTHPPAADHVHVDRFTDGLLDPAAAMLGPVSDGGIITADTAPGCWGPMITPRLRGGHEVTVPVAVAGAKPGDAIAIRIRDITITSHATASGHDAWTTGHYCGDPYVSKNCPTCGAIHPTTHLEGIGQEAVRCDACGTPLVPFRIVHGYTVVFDDERRIGVTVPQAAAEAIAHDAAAYARIPAASVQHSILTFAPHDMPGALVRLRPFLGQLGTTPGVRLPDSHNAGDFGSFLIGAEHAYAVTADELAARTDGHMDIDAVRPGTILVAPVRVPGGGVYLGDMHALQGDGEIAGHTADVAGRVTLQVNVLPNRTLEGPVLFPLLEDLPPLARPFTAAERAAAEAIAARHGVTHFERTLPISVIGTGPNLNAATDCGLARAATLLGMSVAEVRNRATITGAIEIGRHPGVVQITFLAPIEALRAAGLAELAQEAYPA
jgi:formamidase